MKRVGKGHEGLRGRGMQNWRVGRESCESEGERGDIHTLAAKSWPGGKLML